MTTGGRLACAVIMALAGGGGFAGAAQSGTRPANASAPTFNADVAPILQANCVTCHRAGEMAPMSLVSYEEARPWARAIKAKVLTREMPPWFADPQFGRFRNERRLTQGQIDTLVAWVDAGAPQGTGSPPVPRRFVPNSSGFMDRPPDYVLQMPAEIAIPATGEPPYVKLWSKSPFPRDVYIEAIELRPGNRKVTHHSSVGGMPLPDGARVRTAPAWPGGPTAKDAVAVLRDGSPAVDGTTTGNVLVFYVPGGGFERFRPGMARRLRRNDYLLWSIHYQPTGQPETDRHTLALWLAKAPPTHEVVVAAASESHFVEGQPVSAGDPRLLAPIPPYADNFERTGVITFKEPVTLVGLWPHMHRYGKDMTFVVTYPDGRRETLLRVPKYDVAWEIQYELQEPLKLPPGSSIAATAHWDNSRSNPRNPAPDQPVAWGLQSWNEMFGPFLEIVYDNRRVPRVDPFAPDCGLFAPGQSTSPVDGIPPSAIGGNQPCR
jgi:hypothetical protein